MNEELQAALAEMITRSVAVAGDALAFTQEQLPEVVQQLLLWKLTASLIAFVACLLLIVCAIVGLVRYLTWTPKPRHVAGIDIPDGSKEYLGRLMNAENFVTRYHAKNLVESLGGEYGRGDDSPEWLIPFSIVTGVLGVSAIPFSFDWLQIWLAPKVYLIEYASNLIR